MEKLGIKPKHNKENGLKELKRLTNSSHQIKEVITKLIFIILMCILYLLCTQWPVSAQIYWQ